MKDQIPVMDLPLLGKTKKLPFPATLFTAVIVAVRMFPAFVFFLCIPDYLLVRPDPQVIWEEGKIKESENRENQFKDGQL